MASMLKGAVGIDYRLATRCSEVAIGRSAQSGKLDRPLRDYGSLY
jgi:hypothetical protein